MSSIYHINCSNICNFGHRPMVESLSFCSFAHCTASHIVRCGFCSVCVYAFDTRDEALVLLWNKPNDILMGVYVYVCMLMAFPKSRCSYFFLVPFFERNVVGFLLSLFSNCCKTSVISFIFSIFIILLSNQWTFFLPILTILILNPHRTKSSK